MFRIAHDKVIGPRPCTSLLSPCLYPSRSSRPAGHKPCENMHCDPSNKHQSAVILPQRSPSGTPASRSRITSSARACAVLWMRLWPLRSIKAGASECSINQIGRERPVACTSCMTASLPAPELALGVLAPAPASSRRAALRTAASSPACAIQWRCCNSVAAYWAIAENWDPLSLSGWRWYAKEHAC